MKNTYLELLNRCAAEAGTIMRRHFRPGIKIDMKADETPVTIADREINRRVVSRFKRHAPHVAVRGEEESRDVAGAEYVLIVDPVDGTWPYCHGVPVSSFCATLLQGYEPVCAVVYDPFARRTWAAELGKGAYLNGAPIRVSEHRTLQKSAVTVCTWHVASYNMPRVCWELGERGANWLNPQSAACFGAMVASANMDAFIFPAKGDFESPAIQLIVEEAGGRVTDMHGHRHAFGSHGRIEGCLATNGHLHEQFLELIRSCQY